jgi:hypothetical protein
VEDRRSFEDDTAAKQRLTGEPLYQQVIVLVLITCFNAAILRFGP